MPDSYPKIDGLNGKTYFTINSCHEIVAVV